MKRPLDNKTLDTIGRKLFESEGVPSSEIDKMVSSPHLFELVKARIAANKKAPRMTTPVILFQFVRRNAIAFAGIAVLIVAAIGAGSLLRTEKTLVALKEVQIPDAVPDVARPEVPPQPFVGKLSAGRALKSDYRVENAVAKRTSGRINRVAEPEAEFYPVGYTGDPSETTSGGRIIRVNLNRSSLFALGVSLSLENDGETVKADLLVGSDGVTRGVRVVN